MNLVCVCVYLKVFRSRSCTSQEVRGLTLIHLHLNTKECGQKFTPWLIYAAFPTHNSWDEPWMNRNKCTVIWAAVLISIWPTFQLTNHPNHYPKLTYLSFLLSFPPLPISPSAVCVLFMLCVSRFDLWPLVSCERGLGKEPACVWRRNVCVVFVESVLVLVLGYSESEVVFRRLKRPPTLTQGVGGEWARMQGTNEEPSRSAGMQCIVLQRLPKLLK